MVNVLSATEFSLLVCWILHDVNFTSIGKKKKKRKEKKSSEAKSCMEGVRNQREA